MITIFSKGRRRQNEERVLLLLAPLQQLVHPVHGLRLGRQRVERRVNLERLRRLQRKKIRVQEFEAEDLF